MQAELGDEYVDAYRLYEGRVPAGADLVCYWFEKAREQIEDGQGETRRAAGDELYPGRSNRRVLERIRETGGIFFAESDRPWILDGAAVRVSMVGFDDGSETREILDGAPAARSTLTSPAPWTSQ